MTALKRSNNSNNEITEKSTSISNSVMSTPELQFAQGPIDKVEQ